MAYGNDHPPSYSNPAWQAAVVTPNDSTDLTGVRGVYVGGGGHLNVLMNGDTATTLFSNVPAGVVLPISVKRVYSTSTTATLIVVLK